LNGSNNTSTDTDANLACPGRTHIQVVKRVFRYLCRTSHCKLEFQANDSDDTLPIVYVDSDWGGDHMDRKSNLGFALLLDGGAISWGSKKQSTVLLSTVEAEFIAASTAVKEVLWHRALFSSLDMALTHTARVLIDNQGALELIKSGHINDCTKHIDTKYRHICNRKNNGDIRSEHVDAEDQVADIMTKPLGTEKFLHFCALISIKG